MTRGTYGLGSLSLQYCDNRITPITSFVKPAVYYTSIRAVFKGGLRDQPPEMVT